MPMLVKIKKIKWIKSSTNSLLKTPNNKTLLKMNLLYKIKKLLKLISIR